MGIDDARMLVENLGERRPITRSDSFMQWEVHNNKCPRRRIGSTSAASNPCRPQSKAMREAMNRHSLAQHWRPQQIYFVVNPVRDWLVRRRHARLSSALRRAAYATEAGIPGL